MYGRMWQSLPVAPYEIPGKETQAPPQSPTFRPALSVLQFSRERATAVPDKCGERGCGLPRPRFTPSPGSTRFTNNHRHAFRPLVITGGNTTTKDPVTITSTGKMLCLRITAKAETVRELW